MIINQTAWSFYTTYAWDYGLLPCPTGGPLGSPVELINIHPPVCYKTVCWIAQAQNGGDPQPPDWNTGTTNERLLSKVFSTTFLWDLGDGTTGNTMGGIYRYVLLVPPSDTDNLAVGGPPWDASLANLIIPSAFMKGLLAQPAPTNPTGTGTFGGMTALTGQGNQQPPGLPLGGGIAFG